MTDSTKQRKPYPRVRKPRKTVFTPAIWARWLTPPPDERTLWLRGISSQLEICQQHGGTVMSDRSDKLKEIIEKLRIAHATAFVCQQALTHGETDLEILSSDVLEGHMEPLTECYDDLASLARKGPRPPRKPKPKPDLRVVERKGAA
jgi:hypothetical protein